MKQQVPEDIVVVCWFAEQYHFPTSLAFTDLWPDLVAYSYWAKQPSMLSCLFWNQVQGCATEKRSQVHWTCWRSGDKWLCCGPHHARGWFTRFRKFRWVSSPKKCGWCHSKTFKRSVAVSIVELFESVCHICIIHSKMLTTQSSLNFNFHIYDLCQNTYLLSLHIHENN